MFLHHNQRTRCVPLQLYPTAEVSFDGHVLTSCVKDSMNVLPLMATPPRHQHGGTFAGYIHWRVFYICTHMNIWESDNIANQSLIRYNLLVRKAEISVTVQCTVRTECVQKHVFSNSTDVIPKQAWVWKLVCSWKGWECCEKGAEGDNSKWQEAGENCMRNNIICASV